MLHLTPEKELRQQTTFQALWRRKVEITEDSNETQDRQNGGFQIKKCCPNPTAPLRDNVYVAANDHSAFLEMQSVVKGSEGHNGDGTTQHKTGKEGKPQSVVKPDTTARMET